MNYTKYRYIYPPRPENKIPFESLSDDSAFMAQPKLDGSNLTVYTDGNKVILMTRHNSEMSNVSLDKNIFKSLHRGTDWMAINGEYMNKSKNDGNNKLFNHKFIIFDIIVFNGRQTVGMTFKERYDLLCELYSSKKYDNYINKINNWVYIVNTFNLNFTNIFKNLITIDMYEGLVLKQKNAKLKNGISQKNNTNTQLKIRKKTKNYNY